ncbi:universal stress protein [Streptomyces sp. NPDC102274]|uniref:universal stress protein n=1 Tax=Streptomyces sp. NPDC102274 TaxID=3366151 RepID=UPI0038304F1C
METRGFELGCDGPSVLVVGIDGSDTSWRAMYYAFGLARRQHSTVIAVFVVTTAVAFDGTPMLSYQGGIELGAELGHAVKALADEYHVTAHFMCLTGDPVLTLSEVAAEQRADAVIIGASRSFGHRFFGSKAVRTVRRRPCPVTVVP